MSVQNLNDIRSSILQMKNIEEFEILRKVGREKKSSQRELAKELGFSLGKLNYCLKSLKQKGLLKIKNFENNKNKINYIYILTPNGISKKARLTIAFMKLKLKEYDELKKEVDQANEK